MEKSGEALTPRERTAVVFARKLTREPGAVSDADYAALVSEFQPGGALEVLMQTATFSFMNRFTDGLRLPSEDDAIRVYREVYGLEFTPRHPLIRRHTSLHVGDFSTRMRLLRRPQRTPE